MLLLFSFVLLARCGGSDSNDEVDPISDPAQVSRIMNSSLQLPPGTFIVNPEDVDIDESITINGSNNNTAIPLSGGQVMNNSISFNAPNGNVNAVGMRFGTTGPIYFVPINANGNTSGTGTFSFSMLESICNDLSRICHDIKCYEFASTTAGSISRANIRNVAMMCGNCDEPSCRGLVDLSDCGGLSGEDGNPRFNLTWSGSADLDLYVTDPTGSTISFNISNSASGGVLDVDCTGGCNGGNSENITWANGGPSGQYKFYVNNYSNTGSVSFIITIRDNGATVDTISGTTSSSSPYNSNTWTYTK